MVYLDQIMNKNQQLCIQHRWKFLQYDLKMDIANS